MSENMMDAGVVERLALLRAELAAVCAGLEPEALSGEDAAALYEVVVSVGKLADGAATRVTGLDDLA